MPSDDSPLDLLRRLKGAPLSCLHAMCLAGAPVQARWLCETTGYSAGTITQALKVLLSGGLVVRVQGRDGWLPTPGIAAVGLALVRNFYDHPEKRDKGITTTAALTIKKKPVAGTGSGIHRPRNRKKPDRSRKLVNPHAGSKTNDHQTDDYSTDAILRKVLRNAGIGEPKASYLAGLPYVTVEYACALHHKTYRLGQDARLLIYRIQQQDPMPERCHGGICPECILYSSTARDRAVNLLGEPDLPDETVYKSEVGSTLEKCVPLENSAAPDPSLLQPTAPGSSFSLVQAWQEMVSELLEQRPSARCQAYLRECLPSRFDPQTDRLTVLAVDSSRRDWLQARLATLLSRSLVGFCRRRVEIRFVAPGDEATG